VQRSNRGTPLQTGELRVLESDDVVVDEEMTRVLTTPSCSSRLAAARPTTGPATRVIETSEAPDIGL
jgi:hypothetical protein